MGWEILAGRALLLCTHPHIHNPTNQYLLKAHTKHTRTYAPVLSNIIEISNFHSIPPTAGSSLQVENLFVFLSSCLSSLRDFKYRPFYIIPESCQTPHIVSCWAEDEVRCHLAMSMTFTNTNTKTNTQTKTQCMLLASLWSDALGVTAV